MFVFQLCLKLYSFGLSFIKHKMEVQQHHQVLVDLPLYVVHYVARFLMGSLLWFLLPWMQHMGIGYSVIYCTVDSTGIWVNCCCLVETRMHGMVLVYWCFFVCGEWFA